MVTRALCPALMTSSLLHHMPFSSTSCTYRWLSSRAAPRGTSVAACQPWRPLHFQKSMAEPSIRGSLSLQPTSNHTFRTLHFPNSWREAQCLLGSGSGTSGSGTSQNESGHSTWQPHGAHGPTLMTERTLGLPKRKARSPLLWQPQQSNIQQQQ